ncbi:hypothetical protein CAOG_05513 [Capsaspora owczarzaki ATCC 30864]|uniref:hypothetical protein n=1 Tax=Capsaspora owczarzaki (strain ATCC 30864) TaxID=595528 RepID=UPI0001FE271F|nr:hypothetical protein CAOG_05513 [Capsaspora owczarzaki ATCC 30864]|eukprot:XP_004346186.1 hypothetical protein CAOG_05513 [Capsaspora owczarzaki ATCC 30864]
MQQVFGLLVVVVADAAADNAAARGGAAADQRHGGGHGTRRWQWWRVPECQVLGVLPMGNRHVNERLRAFREADAALLGLGHDAMWMQCAGWWVLCVAPAFSATEPWVDGAHAPLLGAAAELAEVPLAAS